MGNRPWPIFGPRSPARQAPPSRRARPAGACPAELGKGAVVRLPSHCRVLACKVLAHELRHLGVEDRQAVYLDQGLHRYPDDLRQRVGEELEKLEQDPQARTVILGYGYCGGGLEGLASRRVRLVAPRAHDCIPLLLGRLPQGAGVDVGGTFYLSPGWVDFGKTPYTEYFETAARFDEETALWCGRQMLKAYTEVVLIRQGTLFRPHHREQGQAMARLFGLAYRETPGGLGWLEKVLSRQEDDRVMVVEAGQPLRQDMFTAVAGRTSASDPVCPCRTS